MTLFLYHRLLQESKKINLSLMNLGTCIAALASGARHVPYRNGKLTHLLMNSLGACFHYLAFYLLRAHHPIRSYVALYMRCRLNLYPVFYVGS